MKKIIYILIIFSLSISCNWQQIINPSNINLKFSSDTIFFDTIFPNLRSITKILKIYNQTPNKISIDKIVLAGDDNSPFRLNINGLPTNSLSNIPIEPFDSIYVFIDVILNKLKSYTLTEDKILIYANDKLWTIPLIAVGWDVTFLKKAIIQKDTTWTNEKPVLIFDYLIVDTGTTLTIEPGTKIFFYNDAVLYVLGSIKAIGQCDNKIEFSTYRLDVDYKNVPGQWGAIVLTRLSQNNQLLWTKIRNATIGLLIDSVQDTVIIAGSEILHNSYAGIFASVSNIKIFNSLIADAGWYAVALIKGGNYSLYNTTIANYYAWGTIRRTPAFVATNYALINDEPVYWQPITLKIVNSIIYGSLEEEFVLSTYSDDFTNFEYQLSYNLLKTKQIINCDSCQYSDPKFADIQKFDFHITDGSPAIGAGNNLLIINYLDFLSKDLDCNLRLEDNKVEIGAYEFLGN